jgi:hypothetical protein
LVIDTSDLAADPAQQMSRVTEFLGLDQFPFAELDRVHNPGAARVADHPFVAAIRRRRRLADLARRLVPDRARKRIRSMLGRPVRARSHLSEPARRRVAALLQDDMRRLRDEYGVDIGKWHIDT